MNTQSNPYLPMPAIVEKITIENDEKDLKTFRLALCNKDDAKRFSPQCGQFAMLSVSGIGEIPIGIASSPLDAGYAEFTVKRYATGRVTTALHDLSEGDSVGLRGPLGNGFPMNNLVDKNILIVSGGFAFTTLRATIRYLLDEKIRKNYGKLSILYGARSPGELLYKEELKAWQSRSDMTTCITVDKGDDSWKGRVGLVPMVLKEMAPSANNACCLLCGPPIMLKYSIPPLIELGFTPDTILTSLERKMSCGIGKCGRCNVGPYYVCKDGPVFPYAKIKDIADNGL
jgi:NAD(P)H-flavin reductase